MSVNKSFYDRKIRTMRISLDINRIIRKIIFCIGG